MFVYKTDPIFVYILSLDKWKVAYSEATVILEVHQTLQCVVFVLSAHYFQILSTVSFFYWRLFPLINSLLVDLYLIIMFFSTPVLAKSWLQINF